MSLARIKSTILKFNVEPYTFFLLLSLYLQSVTLQQLLQDKICVQKYNKSIDYCHDLGIIEASEEKSAILTDAVNLAVYGTVAETIPMVIFAIAMGPVCNKYISGRKMFMLSAALSGLTRDILFILNSIYFEWPALYTIISYVPYSMVGNYHAAVTCVYSYISLYVPNESRAGRFLIIEASMILPGVIAPVITGALIDMNPVLNIRSNQVYNYVGVFSICFLSDFIAFFWAFMTIHEKDPDTPPSDETIITKDENQNEDEKKSLLVSRNLEKVKGSTGRYWTIICDILNPYNIYELFLTLFKKRPNGNRSRLLLTIFCLVQMKFSYSGAERIKFAFTEHMYQWSAVTYSYYFAIFHIMSPVIIVTSVPILTKFLKFNDFQIAIVGCVSSIMSCIAIGTNFTSTGMFVAWVLGVVFSLAPSSTRSMMSKLVPLEDVTKIFAAQAIMDSLTPSIGASLYAAVFSAYPSLVYYISALLHFIPMVFYVVWDIKDRARDMCLP